MESVIVNIHYEIENENISMPIIPDLDRKIREFFKENKFRENGSGSGFGIRDMQFQGEVNNGQIEKEI